MALLVSMSFSQPGIAGASIPGVIAVTNTGGSSASIYSIQVTEQTQMGAMIGQPQWLTPNVAPGTYPTISASGTSYYPFTVNVAVPNTPGPGLGQARAGAFPAANAFCVLQCVVQGNDGSAQVGSASVGIALGSSVSPFPVPQGGALQFNNAGNGVNWFFP